MTAKTTILPADNEITNPEAPATSVWKARVPSGDRRLVLSAIDDQLAAAKNVWREKHCDEAGSAKEEFFIDCMDRTGAAIKEKIDSATIAVDEEEMDPAPGSFRTRLLSTAPFLPSSEDGGSDDDSLSSIDNYEGDISFEDDEIIDQDAHDQVKQLRARAREISAGVISIREEAAGRALGMARRDLSELVRRHDFSENSDENSHEAPKEIDRGREVGSVMGSMHVALQTLASSMRNVDDGLAERIDSMKETVGTIHSSVEKYQRLAQGDRSMLSQTEKALLANEEPKEAVVESTVEDSKSPMNPDEKLACLLAGVL